MAATARSRSRGTAPARTLAHRPRGRPPFGKPPRSWVLPYILGVNDRFSRFALAISEAVGTPRAFLVRAEARQEALPAHGQH